MRKVYVRFGKPETNDPDEDPPVVKVWDQESVKPSRKVADGRTYVYELTDDGQLINERVWDGKE